MRIRKIAGLKTAMFFLTNLTHSSSGRAAAVLWTLAALGGVFSPAELGVAQETSGTGSVTVHVTDIGVLAPNSNLWNANMKTGDVFYPGQPDIYDLRDVRSQVLIPMPTDEDMKLSSEKLSEKISTQLIQAVKDRQKAGISEFDVQLVEHTTLFGYMNPARQDTVVKFGNAAYTAIDRLTQYLENQHKAVNLDLILGSNGTEVWAKNVDAWKPISSLITHVEFDDGRAAWEEAVKAISTVGQSKVTIFNTTRDIWASDSSVGNSDVVSRMQEYLPGIKHILLVAAGQIPNGQITTHTSFIGEKKEEYSAFPIVLEPGTDWTGSSSGWHAVQLENPINSGGPLTPNKLRSLLLKADSQSPQALHMSIPQNGDHKTHQNSSQDLGGIDFTTLRLSYVHAKSRTAVDTVYSLPKGDSLNIEVLSGDHELPGKTFRIAAAMPANAFWVNLNPNEPYRIADHLLGKTDVARVLLQADLQLKRDSAAITDPRTSPVGQEYWNRILAAAGARGNGAKVVQGTRVWIVPGKVVIAGDDDRAYLESAQLEVKLESQYLESRSASGATLGDRSGTLAATDTVARELILPILNNWVNSAPQYEELRQVFSSLVLAQWYKDHHGRFDGGDSALKDSPSDPSWTPRETWLEYMHSLKYGEYSFSKVTTLYQESQIETYTLEYFDGGVDFTQIQLPVPRPLANDELDTMKAALLGTHQILWHDRLWLANLDFLGATGQVPAHHQQKGSFARVGVILLILLVLAMTTVLALRSSSRR
jgi:hypothetical protein